MRRRPILLPLTAAVAAILVTVKADQLRQGLAAAAERPPVTSTATVPAAPALPAGDTAGPPAPLCTADEMAVLQALADRRDQLEAVARALADRDALLRAAEARIDEKQRGLQALKESLEATIERRDALAEEDILSLVKMYEAMKPKHAARIFETLDLPTLLLMADRMSERKLAPVLALMSAEKAQAITVELATARQRAVVADDQPAG